MSDHIICAGRRPSVVIQNLRSALTYLKFRRKLVGGQEKMAEHYLGIEDAWMNEAQEMSNMVEDIESKIKNEDLENQKRLTDNSKSKLFQVGIKLDRLDSLLHNPHSKPILTKEDLEFRWNMLSEFRRRTRSLALTLYTSPSTKSQMKQPKVEIR
ncbi:uncharacterized protein [Euphorbia lathyris]|uniref:uncharacterized protein isoform X3 n=1 Tax=Euphorbia lathyris TaxID=212925 RepID=UPI0033139761